MTNNAFRSSSCFSDISILFGHVEKRLGKKVKVNFKLYEVINWERKCYNTYIAQYLKK